MAHGGGQLPVKEPVGVVLGAVEVEKVLQYLGGADQPGEEHFGKQIPGAVETGDVIAAHEVVPGDNSRLFPKADIADRLFELHN